jgi:hypothetical protein
VRSQILLVVLGLSSSACGQGGHGGVPGEELGTYGVVGQLTSSSCGENALGAVDPWQFEVRLSRADRELFWLNGREAIAGRLETDGVSFGFETRVEVEALPAERGQKACVVSRSDRAHGVLSASSGDVLAFTGALEFSYTAVDGFDCSPLVGVSGGFEKLPCSMAYGLEAMRTQAPEPH